MAVASVVVYHFGGGDTSWLPGGFLGVDVFFVLSGYLITSLLLTEYSRHGRIDLPGFWVRRVRRLVPALVAMLLVVCGWIWWATPLESFPQRRSDLMWTVGYLANWHLISKSDDYFAAYSAASPLRHTWSLAVEEQFYLVWPLLLAIVLWAGHRWLGPGRRAAGEPGTGDRGRRIAARLPRVNRFVLVGAVAALGVGLSAWAMASEYNPLYPSAAYYSTQGRVQELFVGVLLAVLITWWRSGAASSGRSSSSRSSSGASGPGQPGSRPWLGTGPRAWIRRRRPTLIRYSNPLALLGLAALAAAFIWMSDSASFYFRGGALAVSLAVAVVVGVLDLQPQAPAARALSWGPAVTLGRISYGVYLWHWPVVLIIPVTAQAHSDQVIHQIERVGLTLLLAGVSYRFLEQPIQRDRRWLTSKRRVLFAVLASSALVVGVALPATALPGTIAQQLSKTSDRSCPGGERIDLLLTCVAPAEADAGKTPPDLALLGDSTGRALGSGLDDWARANGTTWIEAAWKRCSATGLLVVPSNLTMPDVPATTCHDQAPGLIRQMLSTYRPKTVLVAEYWLSSQPLLVNGVRVEPGTAEHDQLLYTSFQKLVDEIALYGGRTVFLELPPPGASIGQQYAQGRPAASARPGVSGGNRFVGGYNQILRDVASSRSADARTVSVTDMICPDGSCPAVKGGTLIRMDGLHYSLRFAHELVPVLLRRAGV